MILTSSTKAKSHKVFEALWDFMKSFLGANGGSRTLDPQIHNLVL